MSPAAVDYRRLIDRDHARMVLGADAIPDAAGYRPTTGFRYAGPRGDPETFEVVELHRDVVLLLYHAHDHRAHRFLQSIDDGHWVHVQFCMRGAGTESLGSRDETLETRTGTFTVTSYAGRTDVVRDMAASRTHTTACLFTRGRMIERFFRIPEEAWPSHLAWLTGRDAEGVQAHQRSMDARCYSIIQDMLSCGYRGAARFAFMQARSAELIAAMLHTLSGDAATDRRSPVPAAVRERVERVKRAIDVEHGVTASLGELAARAGFSRSRLAEAFRDVYGVSVQAYAREVRLVRAYDLLRTSSRSVSSIAEEAGYAELSSFTRAFSAKFGASPRQVQRSGTEAATHEACSWAAGASG